MHDNDTNPPAISVRGLGKTWAGGVEAVKGIDFDVASGGMLQNIADAFLGDAEKIRGRFAD